MSGNACRSYCHLQSNIFVDPLGICLRPSIIVETDTSVEQLVHGDSHAIEFVYSDINQAHGEGATSRSHVWVFSRATVPISGRLEIGSLDNGTEKRRQ